MAHVTDGLVEHVDRFGAGATGNHVWLAALEELDRLHDLLKISSVNR